MPATKTILKKAKHEVVVKFSNDAGTNSSTFDLDVDALLSTEVIEGTVKVNLVELAWSGATGSSFTLTRNGVQIFVGGEHPDTIIFSGYVDGVQNTHDIVCSLTGNLHVYLTLRKNSGFETKIETAEFGSYDDPNARGS
ncbi:hypothetical protein EBU71_04205 [bacterium]|nr:hypothetical protein [Candidatus Elulimicrobium humile]